MTVKLLSRDSMDCSLPGSSIHGIFQARVLEWGAISFSFFAGSIPQTQTGEQMWQKMVRAEHGIKKGVVDPVRSELQGLSK